jgi:hypothetical protein|tara:strand:- start:237 stop:944 length:708 start_codon:yes stop_codon:yes gene_type:complete
MKDIIASSCVGLGQLAIGHPFDTAKILIQNKKQWYSLPIKRYYRGWRFPLFYSSIFNITCFTTHERTYKYTNNHFYSGAIGGFAISPITYILESFKIKYQVAPETSQAKPINQKSMITNTFKQLKSLNGLYSASCRETLAMGVYFYTFHKFREYTDSTLLSGAATGIASWSLTYPIDVVMSRQIAQNISIKEAIRQKQLWKGYKICILRAMLVNSVNFKIYETVIHSKILDKYLE